jgi:hypothetical protein
MEDAQDAGAEDGREDQEGGAQRDRGAHEHTA